jgi:hypothetical protein
MHGCSTHAIFSAACLAWMNTWHASTHACPKYADVFMCGHGHAGSHAVVHSFGDFLALCEMPKSPDAVACNA